jgi:DNA polymerase III epsilon subunit-like protein
LDTLLRPARAIPADATVIHGITDAAVVTAPIFSEIYPALLEACGKKRIVAYNAAFDMAMLALACRRAGLAPLPNRWDCAMEHYAAFCGDWGIYHGSYRWLPLPGAGHQATDDCRAVLRLVRWMAHRADAVPGVAAWSGASLLFPRPP